MTTARIRQAYVFTALMVFNAALLFAVLNLSTVTYSALRDRFGPLPATVRARGYGIPDAAMESLYPGLDMREIGDLWRETWVPLAYEPFTMFKDRARAGRYVNVHSAGFRMSTDQGPWPLDRNRYLTVFVFGGSTTFGYGVRDHETVVSHLQQRVRERPGSKPIRFYNFGRANYFLSQERILFQQLLRAGFVPDVALFIDGLNEFAFPAGEPPVADRFQEALDGGNLTSNVKRLLLGMPVTTWLLEQFRGSGSNQTSAPPQAGPPSPDQDQKIQSVINRYVEDKKLIEAMAGAYDVRTDFVWQPVPTYNYELRHHLFAHFGFDLHALSGPGYAAMAKVRPTEPNFAWCADIQTGITEPLYIDPVHYSGAMAGRFAQCIAAGTDLGLTD